jgi:hypothetical protein
MGRTGGVNYSGSGWFIICLITVVCTRIIKYSNLQNEQVICTVGHTYFIRNRTKSFKKGSDKNLEVGAAFSSFGQCVSSC